MKRVYYLLVGIVLLLIITNPSIKAFKEYLGNTSYNKLRRKYNFFICSTYTFSGKTYFAIAGNFLSINPTGKLLQPPVAKNSFKNTAVISTDTTELLPPPPPKHRIGISSLPYKYRIYLALSDNANGFNESYIEFDSNLREKKYAEKTYSTMKSTFGDFNRSQQEFFDSLKVIYKE